MWRAGFFPNVSLIGHLIHAIWVPEARDAAQMELGDDFDDVDRRAVQGVFGIGLGYPLLVRGGGALRDSPASLFK